jgi:putative transposase
MDNARGRKIFQNYWDHGIRDEADFWKHFNYIHHNPVKHSYTKGMSDYNFSSYNYWLKKKKQDWIDSCFEFYPIVDFSVNEND